MRRGRERRGDGGDVGCLVGRGIRCGLLLDEGYAPSSSSSGHNDDRIRGR